MKNLPDELVRRVVRFVKLMRLITNMEIAEGSAHFCAGYVGVGVDPVLLNARWNSEREKVIDEALSTPEAFLATMDEAHAINPMSKGAREEIIDIHNLLSDWRHSPKARETVGRVIDETLRAALLVAELPEDVRQAALNVIPRLNDRADEIPRALQDVIDRVKGVMPSIDVKVMRVDVLPGESVEDAIRRAKGEQPEGSPGPETPPEPPACEESDLLLAARQLIRVVETLYAEAPLQPERHHTWKLFEEAKTVVEHEAKKGAE